MKPRKYKGCLPQITFTSDFHELVEGDLVPGPCVLRYDPLRLVPAQTPTRDLQIVAFVRFHPAGGDWKGVLTVPARTPLGLLADPTGQGFMLESTFTIPSGCDELEVWFSHTRADGQTVWDSEYGQNYWLRFPLHDIEIKKAKVQVAKGKTASQDSLSVEITSLACVERVDLRWRFANLPSHSRSEISLPAVQSTGPQKLWATPKGGIPVPKQATVVFDLVYYVHGHKFTDDNQGHWYIAD
jgi:hypothetical protein